jgi:hypothetical protein
MRHLLQLLERGSNVRTHCRFSKAGKVVVIQRVGVGGLRDSRRRSSEALERRTQLPSQFCDDRPSLFTRIRRRQPAEKLNTQRSFDRPRFHPTIKLDSEGLARPGRKKLTRIIEKTVTAWFNDYPCENARDLIWRNVLIHHRRRQREVRRPLDLE